MQLNTPIFRFYDNSLIIHLGALSLILASSSSDDFHQPLQMHLNFPPPLLFSVFIFFFSHHFPKSVSADHVQFSNFNPLFQCGGLDKIEYPFWLDGHQPHYCGLPGIRLHCQNGEVTIGIMHRKYNVEVLKIGTINNGSKGACPHPNATIDPFFMSYTSKVENATFLFDC